MGTNTQKLGTLIDQIESGELVLPEIQRDFVWKRNNVLLLFDSLYRGLPIGYMLVWKAKTSVALKKLKGKKKIKVGQSLDNFYGYLLDGQQRLTAIKLVKDGDDNYPLMFSLYSENEDEPDEDRFSFMSRSNRNNPWYVSVSDIINNNINAIEIVDRLKEKAEDFDPVVDSNQVLASVTRLQGVMSYQIGVIEYEDDHYRKATELFIRFNSTGKKLKGTDLVSAELAITVPELVSQGINTTCTKFTPNFTFSNTFLIQCIVAVHTSKMNLKKPKDVWSGSDEKEIQQSWKKTEKGLGRVIEFLTGTVKWDCDSWLPSVNSIIPLIYLLAQKKFSKKDREMACKWLLSANFHAIFSGTVHSKLDKILRGLKREPSVQKLINLTKRDMGKVMPHHFETRRKSGGVMSLFISMLRNNNAKDWVTHTPLDGSVMGHNAELQIHHFFPRALLNDNGYRSDQINTFANYTIINKDTNIGISAEEPSSYIINLSIKKKELQDQCIPFHKGLWNIENYDDFINERRKLLAKKANLFLKI